MFTSMFQAKEFQKQCNTINTWLTEGEPMGAVSALTSEELSQRALSWARIDTGHAHRIIIGTILFHYTLYEVLYKQTHWFVALVCCIGLLHWFAALVCCIGLVALVCCIGLVAFDLFALAYFPLALQMCMSWALVDTHPDSRQHVIYMWTHVKASINTIWVVTFHVI